MDVSCLYHMGLHAKAPTRRIAKQGSGLITDITLLSC